MFISGAAEDRIQNNIYHDWSSLLDTGRGKDKKCGAGRFQDGSGYLRKEGDTGQKRTLVVVKRTKT